MSSIDKTITSAANPVVKKLKSLALKKYRDEDSLFMVEGLRDIAEALQSGWTPATLAYAPGAEKEPAFQKVLRTCRAAETECYVLTADLLQRITGRDNAQDVIAAFSQHTIKITDVKSGLWIGLENIRDPGNLGTIIRTADAVKAEGVILIGNTCDPWSPEAVRATMGSFAHINIAHTTSDAFISWRPSFKGAVIGTHLNGAIDYRQPEYGLPMVILMGSESHGLSDALALACDTRVKIPMPGKTESLNLAVAAGLMLYEACRSS